LNHFEEFYWAVFPWCWNVARFIGREAKLATDCQWRYCNDVCKSLMIYIVARITKSRHTEALDRALLMAQGGEFAFVLFSAAVTAQVIDNTVKSNLTAIIVLSMVLTPILGILFKRFTETKDSVSLDNVILLKVKWQYSNDWFWSFWSGDQSIIIGKRC
jgi:hypothetical protein